MPTSAGTIPAAKKCLVCSRNKAAALSRRSSIRGPYLGVSAGRLAECANLAPPPAAVAEQFAQAVAPRRLRGACENLLPRCGPP